MAYRGSSGYTDCSRMNTAMVRLESPMVTRLLRMVTEPLRDWIMTYRAVMRNMAICTTSVTYRAGPARYVPSGVKENSTGAVKLRTRTTISTRKSAHPAPRRTVPNSVRSLR